MLRVLVVGLVLLVGAVFLLPGPQRLPLAPVAATVLSDWSPLPDVRLTDDTGEAFSSGDLRDRFSLLFFGFTHCPDVCPLTLSVLASMRRDWTASHVEPPDVLFVSVDPGRDDPTRIHQYLERFHPEFRGVTGPLEALDPWLEALGVSVHVQQRPDGQPYNVTHNSTVYVVGPGTQLLAVFSAPHDAAVIAADFLKIRQRYLNDPSRSADSPSS